MLHVLQIKVLPMSGILQNQRLTAINKMPIGTWNFQYNQYQFSKLLVCDPILNINIIQELLLHCQNKSISIVLIAQLMSIALAVIIAQLVLIALAVLIAQVILIIQAKMGICCCTDTDSIQVQVSPFQKIVKLGAESKELRQFTQAQLLMNRLQKILFHPFEKSQDIQQIVKAGSVWKSIDMPYEHILKISLAAQSQYQLYGCLFLTARVLRKLAQFFATFSQQTQKPQEKFQGQRQIQKYILENQLQVVYERNLFRQPDKNKRQHQQKSGSRGTKIQLFYNYCVEKKVYFFIQLLTFLAAMDIIELEGHQSKRKNPFMNMLWRVNSEEQRQMLVKNYSLYQFQELRSAITSKNSWSGGIEGRLAQILPNYMFYKNKKLIRQKMNLAQLHKKYRSYRFLEEVHDYIQWMFPNHYASGFNDQSYALNYLQSQLFSQDMQVAANMFVSILLFLDFMGLKFDDKFQLVIQSRQRLQNVLLRYRHNHLRLMRILACLSITTYRQIAIKLVDFLDQLTSKEKNFAKIRKVFIEKWQIYGQNHEKAMQMCFLQKPDFPARHTLLKQFLKLSIERVPQTNGKGTENQKYEQNGINNMGLKQQ